MNYYIGDYYRYPGVKKKFKLKEKVNSSFLFECGHWCTDTVFLDLLRVKTNQQVNKDSQLEINFK